MSATSCVDMPSSSVVVTPTPPSVATPIEADAYTVPIDEAVAILSLEVGAVLPGKQEKFPGVEMDEMDLKTHLTDYVTSTETVDRQPPQPAVGMQEDIASATPSAEPPDSTAPPFRSPVEATFHHAIPALHTAPMVTPRPPRQGRRRYLLPSAAAVVIALLAGAWLLLRHSASQPAAHPVPVHSTSVIPEPATTWSFPPLQAGVDQLIFTFSNPGNAAVQVRITAPGAGNEVVWSARVSPQSGAETALDPHVYNGTLAVQASGPVVAERTTVHHGTVQYTYGIPAGRSGRP
jgi:hypothetical protein